MLHDIVIRKRAIDLLRGMNRSAVLGLPQSAPTSFIRERWAPSHALAPTVKRRVAQYSTTRTLEAGFAVPKSLHDRAVFIDGQVGWALTQLLKDFAKRSPAEIVRADDTAVLKIAA